MNYQIRDNEIETREREREREGGGGKERRKIEIGHLPSRREQLLER